MVNEIFHQCINPTTNFNYTELDACSESSKLRIIDIKLKYPSKTIVDYSLYNLLNGKFVCLSVAFNLDEKSGHVCLQKSMTFFIFILP